MGDTTLRELVYGKGAHVDPVACVEDISAELAGRIVAGYPHSIWQIVEHMNYWMDYELAKIAGENPRYPDRAIESWPAHTSPAADGVAADQGIKEQQGIEEQWQDTTRRFTDLLARLARIAKSEATVLERKIQSAGSSQAPRELTVHSILWQITLHNTYHTGQLAMLRRQFGAWPPERCGDTW
jgi:hypothetical protein